MNRTNNRQIVENEVAIDDITENKKKKYSFQLSETSGNRALDIVEKKVAEIKN